jgi:hypothetical protein
VCHIHDGQSGQLLLHASGTKQSLAIEVPWPVARISTSLSREPKAIPSLPTQPRQQGETVFLTYHDGDGWGEADDSDAAQANLGDAEGDLRGFCGDGKSTSGSG